jgi:hypothetical protein
MGLLRTCLAALLGLMLGANVLAQNGGSSTMLDTLFAKLQTATDPVAIQSLEAAIWEQWIVVPDGPQRELMMRGIAEAFPIQSLVLRDAIAGRDVLAADHERDLEPILPHPLEA